LRPNNFANGYTLGFELMRIFKKGQIDFWKFGRGIAGEILLIER